MNVYVENDDLESMSAVLVLLPRTSFVCLEGQLVYLATLLAGLELMLRLR
jgi:hypothetical protein